MQLFDRVTVAVASTERHHKNTLFSLEERIEMFLRTLPDEIRGIVRVEALDGLLVDFARARGIHAVVRGLRFFSDFEYELQMGTMNQRLWPELNTLFLLPTERYAYVNSSLVKEIARNGGKLRGLVHPFVARRLKARFEDQSRPLAGGS
jgi:pantetheine-phosphate adenylyltransferase